MYVCIYIKYIVCRMLALRFELCKSACGSIDTPAYASISQLAGEYVSIRSAFVSILSIRQPTKSAYVSIHAHAYY